VQSPSTPIGLGQGGSRQRSLQQPLRDEVGEAAVQGGSRRCRLKPRGGFADRGPGRPRRREDP
jgi:hypothetical protein